VREVALRAIDALCLSPPTSTDRLLAAGFLDCVLSLLRNGDTTLYHCALKAAHLLCQVLEESKKTMGDAGFMPELVSVLGASKSPVAREMAVESLYALVSVHHNWKRFVQEDRVVARVLQLLGPDEEKPTPAKRFLLSTEIGEGKGRRITGGMFLIGGAHCLSPISRPRVLTQRHRGQTAPRCMPHRQNSPPKPPQGVDQTV
jgi:hypothetical protein